MQKHAVSISSNPSESCELIYILENEILKETSLVSSCLNFEWLLKLHVAQREGSMEGGEK